MKELILTEEYMEVMARIYYKIRCKFHMGKEQSEFLSSDIGVKQGYPVSTNLFGL